MTSKDKLALIGKIIGGLTEYIKGQKSVSAGFLEGMLCAMAAVLWFDGGEEDAD